MFQKDVHLAIRGNITDEEIFSIHFQIKIFPSFKSVNCM